jgi:hypothetical protein
MATSYTIEVGYMSGYSYDGSAAEAWNELCEAARAIVNNPVKMATEARAFGAPFHCCEKQCSTITDYCEVYKNDWTKGGPLKVVDEANKKPYLHISCSGGEDERQMKEHVARAFVRLLIEKMHHKKIEISVRVG